MIRSYRDSITEQVDQGRCPKGFPADLLKVARRKLAMVHAATELRDLRAPPNNNLHELQHDRKGQHAICINDQFRICFRWHKGDAYEVEITNYHK